MVRPHHRRGRVLLACALLLGYWPARAQPQSVGAGDAHGHEHGAPTDRLGSIDFPTSAAPAAHAEFIRGVLFMHNFHYGPAVAAFRKAQELDPGDVMSYWGEALAYTHPV